MIIDWAEYFPGSVTVCDPTGIILDMNDFAAAMYSTDGGRALIGSNALDCHPPAARQMMVRMLAEQQTNVYTIERNGVRKLVYQAPWFQNGQYAGFVELIMEIPSDMPHFVRQ